MKIKLTVAAALIITNTSFASICQTIEECQTEAKTKNFSYLPRYLEDKKTMCSFSSSKECESDAVKEAHEVLMCRQSEKRKQQMSDVDREQIKYFVEEYGSAEIPERIQYLFDRLVAAADTVSGNTFPWSFNAYNAAFINAHAGADSQVMASAALWNSQVMDEHEIAAILAHETAHIINVHSLELGCLALEWTGPNLHLAEAMQYFREDFSTATERGQVWSQLSNKIEFEADAVATKILNEAGIDPYAMASALKKLRPKEGGGFSSGSHPEFDVRIEAALEAAKRTLNQ